MRSYGEEFINLLFFLTILVFGSWAGVSALDLFASCVFAPRAGVRIREEDATLAAVFSGL